MGGRPNFGARGRGCSFTIHRDRERDRTGVKSEAEIQNFREWVSTIEVSQAPGLHQIEAAEAEERELRTVLIQAEYENDLMSAGVALFRLANRRFNVARP